MNESETVPQHCGNEVVRKTEKRRAGRETWTVTKKEIKVNMRKQGTERQVRYGDACPSTGTAIATIQGMPDLPDGSRPYGLEDPRT